MKTSLDHLPLRKRRELGRVVEILFAEFEDALKLATSTRKKKGRILKIILFGSYARGDWVDEYHKAKGYQSDYDLLIIVSHKELTDKAEYWYKAEDWLLRLKSFKPETHFIVQTLHEVNDALARGEYFFVDIKREGIALYELKGHRLAEPKPLNPKDAYEIAEKHFDLWFENSNQNFILHQDAINRKFHKIAAFLLHQATETAYNCLLLVLTNYTPSNHDIKFLRSLSEDIDRRLIDAWPRYYKRHRRCFELLKRAYVEARYSEHYEITAEELEWLGRRVQHLRALVETVCKERLGALKAAAD